HGGNIQLPCLNHSDYLTAICGDEVYVGFIHMQGLEDQLAKQIVEERHRGGPYLSLEDVLQRLRSAPEQLNLLIRIGALRFTGLDKNAMIWEADFKSIRIATKVTVSLFGEETEPHLTLPSFEENRL